MNFSSQDPCEQSPHRGLVWDSGVIGGGGEYLELVLTSFLMLLESFDEMLKTLLLFITMAV